MRANMKIGIFDSGLGGLIIARAIRKILPEYDYVYYGDTARVPYGNKSHEAVYEFTREAVDHLFRQENCALVIIACNTASARALRQIQQEYLPSFAKASKGRPNNFQERKVLGVLIPAAEEAAKYTRVGVLATLGTVNSNTFPIEIEKINIQEKKQTKVFQNPAPILVPLAEEGENVLAKPFISKYLQPLINKNIDALVLGCTHYPIFKKEMKEIIQENTNKKIKIISQDEIIPKKLKEYLVRHPEITKKLSKNKSSRPGQLRGVKILVTDQTQNLEFLVKKWFGKTD